MSTHGNQILVCGDQRGNLVSFNFPNTLLLRHNEESLESPSQLQVTGVFKGAHGISAVASVSVTSPCNKQDAIVTSVSSFPWNFYSWFLFMIFTGLYYKRIMIYCYFMLILFRGFLLDWCYFSALIECLLYSNSSSIWTGVSGSSYWCSAVIRKKLSNDLCDEMQTGRDGCICKFVVDTVTIKDQGQARDQSFACTGVEDVAAITVVESVEYRQDKRKCSRRLAAGFIASNFILWDLTQQSEVMTHSSSIHNVVHGYWMISDNSEDNSSGLDESPMWLTWSSLPKSGLSMM